MKKIKIVQSPRIELRFETYPEEIREKLLFLRNLIIDTATEMDGIEEIEETLKWGEPSYLVKNGSTIRINWKSRNPDQYAIYFNCSSRLVPTFREVYGDVFKYEKNRAILFDIEDKVPKIELRDCIELALKYHLVKNEPFLGKI